VTQKKDTTHLDKLDVSILVMVTAPFIAWIESAVDCHYRACIEDATSSRVTALLWVVIPLYSVFTLAFVFLPAIKLKRYFNTFLSSLIATCLMSALLAWVLYRPELENLSGLLRGFIWVFIPWFFSIFLGLCLWPGKDTREG